ncbi:hypothetical protein NM688_g9140 [Phlebia brevispora]|uniref:Uncharacterized protein n=1 Tax=Phlebia brevispora TaxID=194682 RepID=A0ACC1RJ42_9APHY|nr:hypothetical protein NM688_g9140 [Phlebia brevispora]
MSKRKKPSRYTDLFYVFEEELDGVKVVTHNDQLSGDGRRVIRDSTTFFTPPSPSKKAPLTASIHCADLYASTNPLLNTDNSLRTDDSLGEQHDIAPTLRRKGKAAVSFVTLTHDPWLLSWREDRPLYLRELLRLEGLRGRRVPPVPPPSM